MNLRKLIELSATLALLENRVLEMDLIGVQGAGIAVDYITLWRRDVERVIERWGVEYGRETSTEDVEESYVDDTLCLVCRNEQLVLRVYMDGSMRRICSRCGLTSVVM